MKKFLAITAALATMFGVASCDNISSSTPPISSNSFNSSNTSSSSSSSSNIEFTSDNYKLEISAKEEYTPHQNNEKKTRHIKRANGNTDEYSWSGNALVITLDDEDIYQLNSLDSFIGQNSAPAINGRILTAPSDASVVQVMGINLLDSDEEVVAPNQFQEIEFDANGIYGSVIGTNYQSIDLSDELAGVIQPRSIKTKTFSSDVGFNIARSNVYLINGSPSNYIDEKTSYKNFASYVTNIDTLKRLLIDRISTTYIDLSPSLINTYFSVTINNLESVHLNDANYAYIPQHVQFTIEAINGEFSYSGEFWFELYDDQPFEVYFNGQKISPNSDGTYDLGVTDIEEYFIPSVTHYGTYNTKTYVEQALNKYYTFRTPSGREGKVTKISLGSRQSIITIGNDFGDYLDIYDTGDVFENIPQTISDGVFTYKLTGLTYEDGSEGYGGIINGFEEGYNPLNHDFNLFFDGEHHENKIDLGNLGETNGDYKVSVCGIDGTGTDAFDDLIHDILSEEFEQQFHIDYRDALYVEDFYSHTTYIEPSSDKYSSSYIIMEGYDYYQSDYDYDITLKYRALSSNYSYSAYVFYTWEQITADYKVWPNLSFGPNTYTSASREEVLSFYEEGEQNLFDIDINSIPDDHFNTTPEYMLSQMGK